MVHRHDVDGAVQWCGQRVGHADGRIVQHRPVGARTRLHHERVVGRRIIRVAGRGGHRAGAQHQRFHLRGGTQPLNRHGLLFGRCGTGIFALLPVQFAGKQFGDLRRRHRAATFHEHGLRRQTALLVVCGHVDRHTMHGAGIQVGAKRLAADQREADFRAVAEERLSGTYARANRLGGVRRTVRDHRIRLANRGILQIHGAATPRHNRQSVRHIGVDACQGTGEQHRHQRLVERRFAENRAFRQQTHRHAPHWNARHIAGKHVERQFRTVQPRVSARTVRAILVKHLRAIQLVIHETQQLTPTEHAHVPLQFDTHHGRVIAGDRGNEPLRKPTFRIFRIRPQFYGARDHVDDPVRGIPRQFLGAMPPHRRRQRMHGIGVETGETQRRRAAIGRRDVACVEIMELEIPRRVENVDVAHALAAITSSTVIEQPRASAPFARPFST